MTTNINSYSSSQMKHIAFSKPRVDDDSRVEALDALTMMLFEEEENKEEEMMMMASCGHFFFAGMICVCVCLCVCVCMCAV